MMILNGNQDFRSQLETSFCPFSAVQIALTIIFSQFLRKVTIGGYPIFALFPIILAIIFTWSYAAIFTAADVWDNSQCRYVRKPPLSVALAR